ASGNCLIEGCVTSTQTTAPGACGGVVTETWTFIDQCQRTISYSRTITIAPAPQAQFTSNPPNIEISCDGLQVPGCLEYSNGAAGDCLIAGCVTSTQTAAPGPCGGILTETWTFIDACQRTISY